MIWATAMESTQFSQVLADSTNLLTTIMTPFIIIVALTFAWRFLTRWERNQALSFEIAASTAPRSSTNITLNNENASPGGYDFVQVADEYKTLFVDAMNGFTDYARLKGYAVQLSTDTSHPGKIGICFTILDSGITVSPIRVRKDVEEYVQKLRDDADLSDMPMAQTPEEHYRIVAALTKRFAHMSAQMDLHQFRADLMSNVLKDLKGTNLTGIGYQPATQNLTLTLQNDGGRNTMRDNYSAENSQNIAQGKHAKATMKNSTIQIGSNHNERSKRIEALKESRQRKRASLGPLRRPR